MTTQPTNHRDVDNECANAHEWVGQLYELYAPRIAAYSLRRTSQDDAADVVAETFLIAWRRRDVIPAEPMTLPWLYGVARRVLANQYRSHHRRTRLHDRLNNHFTQHAEPCTRVESAEDYERVAAALKRLSDDDAEVLRLTAWEALTPAEIASVMDIGPTAARQRLHRARKRLRKQLLVEHQPSGSQSQSQRKRHQQPRGLLSPAPVRRPQRAAFGWELSEEGR